MPINEDRSNLPRRTLGNKPDPTPRFVTKIAEAWHANDLANKEARTRTGTNVLWASDAGRCARALSYDILSRRDANGMYAVLTKDEGETPVLIRRHSNPPSVADAWRMGIGTMVHDALELPLQIAFPEAKIELRIQIDEDLSARADALIIIPEHEEEHYDDGDSIVVIPEHRILLELKTDNGFGFKKRVMDWQGQPAQGPRTNALLQGALAAAHLDVDELVIGYLALENIAPGIAKKEGFTNEVQRFAAEWTYLPGDFIPLAEKASAFMHRVLDRVDQALAEVSVWIDPATGEVTDNDGVDDTHTTGLEHVPVLPSLPPRRIPDPEVGGDIVNPLTGRWEKVVDGNVVAAGDTWHCGYCWHRDACAQDAR